MALFLHCGLCARRQADGLLSRAYWGHVTAGDGTKLSACPACKGRYADWDRRLEIKLVQGQTNLSPGGAAASAN